MKFRSSIPVRWMIAISILWFASSCHRPGYSSASTTTNAIEFGQYNKQLVLNYYKALHDTNWAMVRSFIDKDYQHHYIKDTGFATMPWSGFEEGYRRSLAAFPDWQVTPVTIVAEGDFVSVLLLAEGTHRGSFAGIAATNARAKAPIMLLHQVRNGKLVADWEMMNTSLFIKQLK